MAVEYIENIVELLANLAALLLCLFYYISSKRRGWLYGIVIFLFSLLSSYYWTSYVIIMGEDCPNVSDFMSYTGWNAAFLVIFILLMHMKSPEERRYFHPLMLLPVPLNIWQLTLYLPYGRLFNNLYQVAVCTLHACFSIQGFCWYWKKRKEGAAKPYVSMAVFLFATLEFCMWTFSCFDEPLAGMYYPASILCSLDYLFLVWSIRQAYAASGSLSRITFDRKYQNILKAACFGIVLIISVGGILLGIWMRNVMTFHLDQAAAANVYNIIPIILFVISLVLVAFVIAVISVVYFAQHAAENSQLREARQIAERSSAAKSEFLANMSHEIRTPINAVIGMNEIVLRESRQARDKVPSDSDKVREVFGDICGYAGIIDTAGKNLLSIINDILDFSRIEAGKMEIREDPYLLSSVLRDVCSLVDFRARSRNLVFRVEVDERLPDQLYGDAQRVRQIMLNILNNAVKYTERGSVTLRVYTEAEAVPEEGQALDLAFSVKDTGIGIRPEDMDRLFDKFERIGTEEQGRGEGTGLGLAITRNLLDMMGGTIRVESVFGEGSVFTVTIPQKVVSGTPAGNFREKLESVTDAASLPQELFRAPDARLLVVDDTRMNLTVVEGLLRKTGIRIDTADSGDAALRCALSVPYDLILMDQRMPSMDGTEAMHRIREQKGGANRETPVVCLTADAISGAKEKYLKEGFTDYLSKPIDSTLLQKLLIRCLPPEKVIPLADGEEQAADPYGAPAAGVDFSALREGGVDAARGLKYCRQDADLYRSLLGEFAAAAGENVSRLEEYFAAGAWEDYAILVHSVKGVAATIGASALSQAAAGLEAAARKPDPAELARGHAPLLDLYRRTTETVRPFGGADDGPEDDGTVMEFLPE